MSDETEWERAVFRKVTLRLMPFLGLLYFFNILDRSNIDIARLQMVPGVISEEAYGFGAGIFAIGYCLLEVPSNLILSRVGARRWIARILLSWGVISSATMFVAGPGSFALLRFLLGCAEAGFFPGIVLYLTYWFPPHHRARATAYFMAASPLVWMAGGPLTGLLLHHMDQAAGLAGWQWVFLLEGLPTIFLGFLTLLYLTDRPEGAAWLKADERAWLAERMKSEGRGPGHERLTFRQALGDFRIWHLVLLCSTNALGISVVGFYFSPLIRGRFPGLDPVEIGWLKALCGTVALLAIIAVGAHSDRSGERRWHVAGSAFLAAAGFGMSAFRESPYVSFMGLLLAFAAMLSIWGPFWSLATASLGARASAGGVALINAIGNLGAFFGPMLMSHLGFETGLTLTAGILTLTGALALALRRNGRSGIG